MGQGPCSCLLQGYFSLEGMMLKLKLQYFGPPHAKSWLTGKDSDAGRDWEQEEKETTEDEMAGWHHWLDGHESEWSSGDGDGQGGLVCCNSRGCKELDMTERLDWTELNWTDDSLLRIIIKHTYPELSLSSVSFYVSFFANTLVFHPGSRAWWSKAQTLNSTWV